MSKIIRELTKEEFCEKTRTSRSSWIFNKDGTEDNHKFFECDNGEILFKTYDKDDNLICLRSFKDMPQYHEVWMAQADRTHWSLFNTWSCY